MDNGQAPPEVRESEHRFLERTVALSDGVAAIAITLLVLPLIGLDAPDVDHGETVWDAIVADQTTLMAAGITFVVIAALWFAHARTFARIERVDNAIAWANIAYLLAIVVLPFAADWLQEDGFEAGVGSLYYLVLALASGSLGFITLHANRRPELLTDEARHDPAARTRRGYLLAAFFLLGSLVSWFLPDIAGWYMVLLFPVSWGLGRLETRDATRFAAAPPPR